MGTSFVQDFGSKVIGLCPDCTEGGTDFSCGIHFNIKEYPPKYTYHFNGLSDPDNKIKHRYHDPKDIKSVYAI